MAELKMLAGPILRGEYEKVKQGRFQMASLIKIIMQQQKEQAKGTVVTEVTLPLQIIGKKKKRNRKKKKGTVVTEVTQPPHIIGKKKKKKRKIPSALREQVWIHTMGHVFEGKCPVTWCTNNITVFDFQSGHNIPESKGGPTTLDNLIPLCSRCNQSMENEYTIDEWCLKFHNPQNVPVPVPSPVEEVKCIPKAKWYHWCRIKN